MLVWLVSGYVCRGWLVSFRLDGGGYLVDDGGVNPDTFIKPTVLY